MLPVITCAPTAKQRDHLLSLLDLAAERTGVHTQVIVATTEPAEAKSALEKTQGIALLLTWLPPLNASSASAFVALGQRAMDLNHDSYTLNIVNQSSDLIQAARLCRRSYALLIAEDLRVTAIPILSQALQEFRNVSDPSAAINDDYIMLRVNGTYMRIMKKDILYIEALEKKLVFHLEGKSLALYSSIATYEELLSDQFVRCHRSYLVNTAHIQAADFPALTINLSDGSMIPISRSQRSRIKALLGDMKDGAVHA